MGNTGYCRIEMKELQKDWRYKFNLWKAYFDTGYSMLSYPKYILFLVGLGDVIANDGEYIRVLVIGFFLAIVCLVFGKVWFKYRFIDYQLEVQNQYNPLAREIREKFIKNKNNPNTG